MTNYLLPILLYLLKLAYCYPALNLADNERIVYMDESHIEIDILEETSVASPNDHPFHRELIESKRKLYEEMSTPHTKSRDCKVECIDKKFYFCPMNNFKWGNCCNPAVDVYNCPVGSTDYDPRYKLDANWCSNHNDKMAPPKAIKYLVCPNEESCGGGGMKFMSPTMDGEVLVREMNTRGLHKFVKEDVCSFVIKNPDNMGW